MNFLQDLHGVYAARAFVGWYNGLPENTDVSITILSLQLFTRGGRDSEMFLNFAF